MPETTNLKTKIIISGLIALSVLLVLFKEKLYVLRKYWQELISLVLLTSAYLFLKNTFPDLIVPTFMILLTNISITLLMIFKYRQPFIYKTKILLLRVHIDTRWKLNHWRSNCASILNNKMIFTGVTAPIGTDGSHTDLINLLEIGKTYEISCFAKSDSNTTGQFQLWCHDQTGTEPYGAKESTPFKTPSIKGEVIKLNFRADYNQNIRIHLQYSPGLGRIEISDVVINRLTN